MMKLNWKTIQENSDKILSDGIYQLLNAPTYKLDEVDFKGFGNYLISHTTTSKPVYIGEAQNIKARLKQHSSIRTSTFYKNYLKMQSHLSDQLSTDLNISEFDCRYIRTSIGRKDIEEYGIVNIPTLLNKFQLDKRSKYPIQPYENLWQDVQSHKNDFMMMGESELMSKPFAIWYGATPPKQSGIYWVEHNRDGLIYIGESSDIAKRYQVHSGRTYFSAFRRNLGVTLLGFELQTIKGKKRYFSEQEDVELNVFLKHCKLRFMPILFGRYELEEYLIKKYQPVLNRKAKS